MKVKGLFDIRQIPIHVYTGIREIGGVLSSTSEIDLTNQ
jgi:hypothetical protein